MHQMMRQVMLITHNVVHSLQAVGGADGTDLVLLFSPPAVAAHQPENNRLKPLIKNTAAFLDSFFSFKLKATQ